MAGINLLRDAHQQANQGQIVDFLDEALEGDLAFFDNEEGRITHVGLVLSEHRILHASGSVRVDALDPSGIYHAELGRHTHRLRLIKRFI
jgi:cell wall-associated NlpC family hydrolase